MLVGHERTARYSFHPPVQRLNVFKWAVDDGRRREEWKVHERAVLEQREPRRGYGAVGSADKESGILNEWMV